MNTKMTKAVAFFGVLLALAGSVQASERESGGRETPLSNSIGQVHAVLGQITDLTAQIISVQKIEELHYVVQYLDGAGNCRALGFVVTAAASRSETAFTAVSDNQRRACY